MRKQTALRSYEPDANEKEEVREIENGSDACNMEYTYKQEEPIVD